MFARSANSLFVQIRVGDAYVSVLQHRVALVVIPRRVKDDHVSWGSLVKIYL